jgi:hypothetical protein
MSQKAIHSDYNELARIKFSSTIELQEISLRRKGESTTPKQIVLRGRNFITRQDHPPIAED